MYKSGTKQVISCGRLLSWGWNEHGMCGDGSQTDVSQPQHIPALRPLLIGCGAGHSMALCAVRTGEEKSTEDMEIEQATLSELMEELFDPAHKYCWLYNGPKH
ncbi:unnamed protein product [Coregonus sp. 'balchen']|nr:unnamed protein product [Coregonus sp. 'balchen']